MPKIGWHSDLHGKMNLNLSYKSCVILHCHKFMEQCSAVPCRAVGTGWSRKAADTLVRNQQLPGSSRLGLLPQYTFHCTVVPRCSAHFTGLPCAAHLSSDKNYTCHVAKMSEMTNIFFSCIVTRSQGPFCDNTSNSMVIPYEATKEKTVQLKYFFLQFFF